MQPDPAQPINWDRADKNIGRATSVGITPMIRIRVGSCWATGGEKIDAGRGGLGYSVSTMPVDDAAYQDFVRSVVERYQGEGVDTYALENEVNGEGFWRGSAADYEALVRSGAEAIRSADPDATVTDAGLSSTVWGVVMAEAALDEGRDDEAIALYDQYYERRFARREQDFPRAENADELREALATAQSTRNQGVRRRHVPTGRRRRDRHLPAALLRAVDERPDAPVLPEGRAAGRACPSTCGRPGSSGPTSTVTSSSWRLRPPSSSTCSSATGPRA